MTTHREHHVKNAVAQYDQTMKVLYRQHMFAVIEARRVYDECLASANTNLDLKSDLALKMLLKEMHEAQDTSDEEVS